MIAAERALHTRASLSGRLHVWEQDGVLAVRATDPELSFLSAVSGVTAATLPAAVDLLHAPVWGEAGPALVLPDGLAPASGLVPAGVRPLAVKRLAAEAATDPDVVETDEGFLDVLLAGYEVSGAVAALIAAEHGRPEVRRFLLSDDGAPIAAAAMSVHGAVAVLGGASTTRAHRGKGAQPRLLAHRLRIATDACCTMAVATAGPGSVSAANLRKAGFRLHLRTAWVKSA